MKGFVVKWWRAASCVGLFVLGFVRAGIVKAFDVPNNKNVKAI